MIKKENVPDIVAPGNRSGRKTREKQIEVPVGLEQLLYLAARDETVKADLLADRQGTLDRLGIELRPTETVTLQSVPNKTLETMIDRIRPENPKRRKLMRMVAATATSLAAGTAVISCDDWGIASNGVRPGDYVDSSDDDDAGDGDTNDSDDTESTDT